MLNRASCACLLLAALAWSPSSLMAQEVSVTIGSPRPARVTDGRCPAYVSTRREDGPGGGSLNFEESVTTSETNRLGADFSAAAGGLEGSIGGADTRTTEREYAVGYYTLWDGTVVALDCRTLREVKT